MENPKTIEEHLTKLKKLLVFEDEFSNTFNYFFDHLAETLEFMKLGKRYKSPDLKKIIQEIGKGVFNEDVTVTNMLLTILNEQRFIHGLCRVNGQLLIVFLFKEISMGMAAIKDPKGGTLFARFTIFETPNKRMTLKSLAGPSLH